MTTTFALRSMPTFPVDDGPPVLADSDTGGLAIPRPLTIAAFFSTNFLTYPLTASPFTLVRTADLNVVTGDTTAPVIGSPSPTAGSSVAANALVGADVTDDSGTLAQVLLYVSLPGAAAPELAYDGSAFASGYSAGSTKAAITNGFRFRLQRAGIGFYGTFTVSTIGRDAAGNATTQAYSWVAPAYPTDIAAPIIGNASPATGSSMAAGDPVVFDVTDAFAGTLSDTLVFATMAGGTQEVAWDGTAFSAGYSAGSTRTAITNGYRFSLVRAAGWVGTFVVAVRAMDQALNLATGTLSWVAPGADATPPAVSNAFPAAASTILATDTIGMDVTDAGGMGDAWLFLNMTAVLGAPELVHDGTSFTAEYAAGSTRSTVTGGYRYRLVRADGFYGALTVTAHGRDTVGNIMTPAGYGWTGPDVPPDVTADAIAPNVAVVYPPAGTNIIPTQTITLEVWDTGLGLLRVLLWAHWSFLEAPEQVHDGDSFTAPYAAQSTRTAIAGGYRYVLMRKSGWPEGPRFTADAFDLGGNET